ncbi:hypothetical protein [Tenacibaculum retecalamus]|uniref:hypothetical protein n=1 Tax=Tenacibaculum retecalamus TaxID=3018315 RepID=UPI0023D935E4|nr:hypothetical protein [Tenacibaculum retecalamus]WBX71889.1 hypothetical protein PG912_03665 [Tenacibaculum retecalamus]
MKKIFLILLMLTTSIFAQKKVNNYKYVIVPNKFDFFNKKDQYQTSSLTKFLFNKYGFIAVLEDEKLPNDLAKDRCLALTGVIKKESGMFSTKTFVELRDCFNNVVYSSVVGKSKLKDYKKAYNESIRNAFKTIEKLNYKYTPLKKEKVEVVNENIPAVVALPKIVVNKPVSVNTNKEVEIANLYAQSTANGYQLVNTKPEVVFQLLKTNIKDVFVIKNKNGILYKKNAIWIAEYYKENVQVIKKYQIKF